MSRALELHHTLGYGGVQPLHYGGEDSCLFACGTMVRRVGEGRPAGEGVAGEGLGVGAMVVHPNRDCFAYCEKGQGAVVRVCDIQGRTTRRIEGTAQIDVDTMSFTADGSALLTVAGLPDFKVTIWDWQKDVGSSEEMQLVSGTAPAKLKEGSFNPVNPDQMCFLGVDNTLYVCNVVAGASGPELEFEKFSPPSEGVTFVSFSWTAAGMLYCTTSDGCLWLADPQTAAPVGESVVISAEGALCHVIATSRHLVCWCSDGVLVWLGLESLSEGYRVKVPLQRGDRLVSVCLGDSSVFAGAHDGSIFQVALLQEIPDGNYRDEEEEPSPVTLKDADVLIGEVQCDSHHRLFRIALSHHGPVTGIAPLPSMGCFASAGSDGVLMLWDTVTGATVAAQRCARSLTHCASHPTKPLVCIGDANGVVSLLDVGAPARIRARATFKLFQGPVSVVSFSHDGQLTAVGSSASPQLYFLHTDGSGGCTVVGFAELPAPGVTHLGWTARTSVVAAGRHSLLCEVRGVPHARPEDAEGLELKGATVACVRVQGDVTGLATSGAGVSCTVQGERKTLVLSKGAWRELPKGETADGAAAAQVVGEHEDHDKVPGCLTASVDGDSVGSCGPDGLVVLRTGPGMEKCLKRRCFSVWEGGGATVAVHASGQNVAVIAGGTGGELQVLCAGDLAALRGAQGAEAAGSVSRALFDLLGEQVEEEIQRTFAETQLLSDLEMQNAMNAARKNATREQLRGLKATLDQLLEHNDQAPEIERIPREEIVLDRELRDSVILSGDERVAATKARIHRENMVKDLMARRIKELAWDSMAVHGARLLSFTTGQTVHNFPIRVPTKQEKAAIERVKAMRRIEIAMTRSQKKELGMSNSLIELAVADTAVGGENAARVAEAAEGVLQGETVEDPDEVWIRNQDDPCLYHRFEVSTRERKTSQIILLEDCITRAKQGFNALFDDFMKRKVVVLGKIEEKNLRIVEIQEELGSNEELFDARLSDDEQPDRVLVVEDDDVKVEKWVSKEEQRRRQEQEEEAKKKGAGEDAADRALMGMMGGTLAGESKVNKLSETLEKPAHLTPGEGEELTEEQAKELKEWEAQKKALEAEQETYRKVLEGENKKLRAEILEEFKKFDDGMQELMDARLKTDYNVYEQELYKIKLIQAVAQEEDDIAASIALKKSLTEMDERREGAARAVDEFSSEVAEAERLLEGLKADSANGERHFKKEVVDPAAAGGKDVAEMLLRTYRRRADLRELPPGQLTDELMQRAEELLEEAIQHDHKVAEAQSAAQAVRGELERLTWTLNQMDEGIHQAEEELQELETRMMGAGSDLDLTFMLKQGQVEVEQAAVAADFSDAEIVEKGVIHANNSLITHSGREKVGILHEIKDFRKGIHVLQWENSRLDLEEEELLQRTKDLQLLRVTKGLQSIIKGSDEGKTAHENSSLEKLVSYQTKVHGQRVKEKAKSVEGLTAQARVAGRENAELDEDIFALESAVVERQRLCELQGTAAQQGEGRAKKSEESKMRMMVTHRKLLDLAKAQTREIELMREELVRLRARTFPSFAQLSQSSLPDTIM